VTSPDQPPSDPWTRPAPDPVGFAPVPPVDFDPPPVVAQPPAPVADQGAVVVQIGELAVTSTVVRTPAGDIPLAGSTWNVVDYWHNEQKTPTWAIVVAVLGFCVLPFFCLLFLLVKETVHKGTVQISVTNGPRQYVARLPVTEQSQVTYLHQQVNYARSLAAI
jgi:hypothetical protein